MAPCPIIVRDNIIGSSDGSMVSSAGIDQVRLFFRDFVIRDCSQLTTELRMRGGGTIMDPMLYVTEGGTTVSGRVATFQGAWYSIHVMRLRDSTKAMSVILNCSRRLRGGNLLPANKTCLAEGFAALTGELDNIGVIVEVASGKISRLEVAQNVEAEYEFDVYRPLFRAFVAGHLKLLPEKRHSMTWASGRRSVSVYAKAAQMVAWCRKQGVMLPTSMPSERLLRFESRFLKGSAVKKHVGISTVREFLRDGFDLAVQAHRKLLEEVFLQWEPITAS